MSSTKHAVETMKFAHGLLNTMIDTVPEDKATYQVHPTSNHVVWTLGHLASTYNWLCSTIGTGVSLPETYKDLFGQGSKPSPEKSKYPSLAEVRKNYDAAFNAYAKLIEGLSDQDAWAAPAVPTGGFTTSKIDGAYKCAWHDGWHLGQIADLRRALGLPPIM